MSTRREVGASRISGIGVVLLLGAPVLAAAQGAQPALNQADTAWMLIATALVLLMTPALAFFYGGLVRSKNALNTMMMSVISLGFVGLLWAIFGYSLAFAPGNRWIGDASAFFMRGVALDPRTGTTIPHVLFMAYQGTFAIITAALISGAIVERMRFSAYVAFISLWALFVYSPIAHWVWGGGWLARLGVLDFAGGLVVHASCGVSALVLVMRLGPRRGFPQDLVPPHSPGMAMMGAAMLWVGWFGFNAGSALAANASAGMAMTVTHISAATAALTWMAIEWTKFGKPTLVGIITGAIAGLATITPGSGFVGPLGALVYGVLAGAVCYWAVNFIKHRLRIDDSLDVFAVHGVGGMMGTLLVAPFAAASLGGVGLPEGVGAAGQLWAQIVGVAATAIWAGAVTFVLARVVEPAVGLRVSPEQEQEGLDITAHGEQGYMF